MLAAAIIFSTFTSSLVPLQMAVPFIPRAAGPIHPRSAEFRRRRVTRAGELHNLQFAVLA